MRSPRSRRWSLVLVGAVFAMAAVPSLVAGLNAAGAADCSGTSVGLTPLNDLGDDVYRGSKGGLYPRGSNKRPNAHEDAGVGLAETIGPLDASGTPSPDGTYGFISIGMSNAEQEFRAFKEKADADPDRDPRLQIVQAAQGGVSAAAWADPNNRAWERAVAATERVGLSAKQIVVAWVKVADAGPDEPFPGFSQGLRDRMAAVARNLKSHFPNVALAYYSSRTYAGYASSGLNPEPFAYQSGFSVKWLVRDQMRGDADLDYDPTTGTAKAPWLSWGPYLWADGLNARSDGLVWECSDFDTDGTHPSASGEAKVGSLLLDFVRSDTTARRWYLAGDADDTAPKISRVRDKPDPFSPNGDGRKDKTTISFELSEAANVTVSIRRHGRIVRHLLDAPHVAGDVDVTWRGNNDAGRLVCSGRYTYRIRAVDAAANRSEVASGKVAVRRARRCA